MNFTITSVPHIIKQINIWLMPYVQEMNVWVKHADRLVIVAQYLMIKTK
jgi:hypothetical protein